MKCHSVLIGQVAHGGQHWHATDACFLCHTCHKSLLNRPFLPRRGFVYCSVPCSKRKRDSEQEEKDSIVENETNNSRDPDDSTLKSSQQQQPADDNDILVPDKSGIGSAKSSSSNSSSFTPTMNSVNELLSSYSNDDEDEEDSEPVHHQQESKTKVTTELARRMLQKNLERLLLNQTESCKDVISQVTGAMTPKQVQKLIEKTNSELNQGSKPKQGIMKKPNPCCSECGASSRPSAAAAQPNSQMPFWTPQTHRKGQLYQRGGASSRTRRADRHHHAPFRRAEMAQSVVYPAQKQFQYYSPQLQRRRKSADLSWLQPPPPEDSSDSSEDELDDFVVDPRPLSAVPPRYYGGVHPVYLPNSRQKAQKLQKAPVFGENSCQGCCQQPHQQHRDYNIKLLTTKCSSSSGDEKRCTIS